MSNSVVTIGVIVLTVVGSLLAQATNILEGQPVWVALAGSIMVGLWKIVRDVMAWKSAENKLVLESQERIAAAHNSALQGIRESNKEIFAVLREMSEKLGAMGSLGESNE